MRIAQDSKILIRQIIIKRDSTFESILLQSKIERGKIRTCIFEVIIRCALISQLLKITSRFYCPAILPDFYQIDIQTKTPSVGYSRKSYISFQSIFFRENLWLQNHNATNSITSVPKSRCTFDDIYMLEIIDINIGRMFHAPLLLCHPDTIINDGNAASVESVNYWFYDVIPCFQSAHTRNIL